MNIRSLSVFPVIGDLVGSRQSADRRAAQQALWTALDRVNDHVEFEQRLEPTVGDEFQGVFATLGDAAVATLLVRLSLPVGMDCRAGIGRGELTVFDAERRPVLQDGPAWWAARAAIAEVSTRAKRPRQAFLRTWYADGSAPDDAAGDAGLDDAAGVAGLDGSADAADLDHPAGGAAEHSAWVNAFLVCRDQMVERLNDANRQLLAMALLGKTQEEMAVAQGVGQSAVSQRLASSGVNAIRDAHGLVRE